MTAPRPLILAVGAALLSWPMLPLQAQSLYQQKIEASTGLEHDSNPGLSPASTGGVTRWRLSPAYTLLRRDGQDDLTLKLGATLEQSSNTALSRDRRDGSVRGEWLHTEENTIYSLRGGIDQSALRDVLLQETGQLSTDGTRTTRNIEGLVVHQLDTIHTLSGGLSASWNRYSSDAVPNGRQYGANAEFSRAIQVGRDIYLAGSLSNFRSDSLAPGVPGAGVQGGMSSTMRSLAMGTRYAAPDDPWSWDVRVGATHYTAVTGNTAATASGQLAYKGARWSTALSFAHQPVADSLRGTFSPNRQLRASVEYALTEFTRVALDASYNRTKGLQTDATREFGLRLSSELTPLWRVSLQLRRVHASHDAMALSTRAGSTIAGLVFTYSHPDF